MYKNIVIAISLLSGLSVLSKEKIVYGEDNRVEFHEASVKLQTIAKSVGGMIFKDGSISVGTDKTMLNPKSLGTKMNLCEGEKFRDQPSSVSCTFFLVSKNIVVTAGHCMQGKDACADVSFLFDYKISSKDKRADVLVDNKNIYKCKKIISSKLESVNKKATFDYALVELDRDVTDRAPLKYRYQGRTDMNAFEDLKVDTPLTVIGHPSGLPLKIADGSKVVEITNKNYFLADLDTFGGNSGSPVFNSVTNEVVGILVRGQTDYVKDKLNKCTKVNTVLTREELKTKNPEKGEAVSNIFQIAELYK